MTTEDIPKGILECIRMDIRYHINVDESVFSTISTSYSKYPEYFTPLDPLEWRYDIIRYMYTDKAKALYYMLKL